MTDDAPRTFDPGTVGRVAAANEVAPERLRDLLTAHQRLVHETPGTGGVAGLIYEWRRAFARDPVLRRADDAFHLAVEPHVWAEYVAALDATDREAAALREVHAAAVEATPDDDREPMLVWRE
ncbi:MAG: hypothetical protein ABEJ43_01310 [Haloferacaceae archaeon]